MRLADAIAEIVRLAARVGPDPHLIKGMIAPRTLHRTQDARIAIADHGPGLPEHLAALLRQEGSAPAPLPESKGLGLWTTGDLVRRLGGHVDIQYPGVGTRIVVSLPVGLEEMLHVAA